MKRFCETVFAQKITAQLSAEQLPLDTFKVT